MYEHKYQSIEHAARCVPLIHIAQKQGVPSDEVILTLLDQIESLQSQLRELSLIAPKKVKAPDGSVWIYRCPDHLIP